MIRSKNVCSTYNWIRYRVERVSILSPSILARLKTIFQYTTYYEKFMMLVNFSKDQKQVKESKFPYPFNSETYGRVCFPILGPWSENGQIPRSRTVVKCVKGFVYWSPYMCKQLAQSHWMQCTPQSGTDSNPHSLRPHANLHEGVNNKGFNCYSQID